MHFAVPSPKHFVQIGSQLLQRFKVLSPNILSPHTLSPVKHKPFFKKELLGHDRHLTLCLSATVNAISY